MKYEIEVDDGVDLEDYVPVRFGFPKEGELFVSEMGNVIPSETGYTTLKRLIVKKPWTPPSWLRECWIAKDCSGNVWAYAFKPFLAPSGDSWCSEGATGVMSIPYRYNDFVKEPLTDPFEGKPGGSDCILRVMEDGSVRWGDGALKED